jgi:phage repressor protein C with HTH and peptisase S24 domain
MNMALGENLKRIREAQGLTQYELSEKTNNVVSQGAISALEKRDSETSRFSAQLAEALGVSINELLGINYTTNEESIHLRANQSTGNYKVESISLVDNPEYPSIRRVNLRLSAGIVGFSIEHDVEDKSPIVMQRQWFESRGYNPAKLLATGVRGDSMSPGMNDGDTVVINTEDTTPVDGVAFAINYEGELTVKRLFRDAGIWWLSSDNPDQRKYPRKQCTGDLCLIIGRIVHKQSEVI